MEAVFGLLWNLLELYKWLLIGRCLLSWFGLNWYEQPWRTIAMLTDPVMRPFQGLIPAIGGIDFSPILLFVVLSLIQDMLAKLSHGVPGF